MAQATTGDGLSVIPAPISAERAHAVANRLRLRIRRRLEQGELEALADRIAACAGVERVVIRPNTRSVIIHGTVPAATLSERLEAAGILRIREPGHTPPIGQMMQFGLMRLDNSIKARTHGSTDLRSTIALLLFAGSLVQTARGRVAGPATTLALSALALIDRGGASR
jgi:hypothetical protein